MLWVSPKSEMESLEAKSVKPSKLVEIEGVSMPSEMVENWNLISGFQARPDDLLLCTYPKAGKEEPMRMIGRAMGEGEPGNVNSHDSWMNSLFPIAFLLPSW